MKTVIIGGVAGGASAAARLRRLDERAEIVIIERGEYVSFANCGLPYYIGGAIADRRQLTLQTPESFRARFRVDVRVRSEAVAVDAARKTVRVNDLATGETYDEPYDNLILSPGAAPVRPPIEIDSDRVFTLRSIPDADRIKAFIDREKPRSAVVAGGGYIGVEMAENLRARGLAVTVAEMADHLIAPLDFDMAADVHRHLRANGIALELNNAIEKISGRTVKLRRGAAEADMILLSVGVRPDTALAASCGVETDRRGSILTDSRMRTNVPGIYAVGDAVRVRDFVTGAPAFIPLAGPANKQGRIAADVIAGYDAEYRGTQGSSVLRLFDMTVAATGLNERTAADAGIDYDKTYLFTPPHATYYPGGRNMSLKVLWDKKTLALLGAQIVGYDGVDKRADVLAAAIRLGAAVTDLAALELCYAPPYGSAKDPVNMAGFVAENVVSGKIKQFFWHDVASLPRDGSVTILDVRTEAEYARGRIDGCRHIPVDDLRARLSEIPAGKPVYVYCHSGQRSYIACRILTGHGYDCFNLAGGWRLYESVTGETARAR